MFHSVHSLIYNTITDGVHPRMKGGVKLNLKIIFVEEEETSVLPTQIPDDEEACCHLTCFAGVDHSLAIRMQSFLADDYKVFWRSRRNGLPFVIFFTSMIFKNAAVLVLICWSIAGLCKKNYACFVYMLPLLFLVTICILFLSNRYCMVCDWVLKQIFLVENKCLFAVKHNLLTHLPKTIQLDPIAESKRYDLGKTFYITVLHYCEQPLDYLHATASHTRMKLAFFHLPKEKRWHQAMGCDVIDLLRPQTLIGSNQKNKCSMGILVAFCSRDEEEESDEFVCFLKKSGFSILFHQPKSIIIATKEENYEDDPKMGHFSASGSARKTIVRPTPSPIVTDRLGERRRFVKISHGLVSLSILQEDSPMQLQV